MHEIIIYIYNENLLRYSFYFQFEYDNLMILFTLQGTNQVNLEIKEKINSHNNVSKCMRTFNATSVYSEN